MSGQITGTRKRRFIRTNRITTFLDLLGIEYHHNGDFWERNKWELPRIKKEIEEEAILKYRELHPDLNPDNPEAGHEFGDFIISLRAARRSLSRYLPVELNPQTTSNLIVYGEHDPKFLSKHRRLLRGRRATARYLAKHQNDPAFRQHRKEALRRWKQKHADRHCLHNAASQKRNKASTNAKNKRWRNSVRGRAWWDAYLANRREINRKVQEQLNSYYATR